LKIALAGLLLLLGGGQAAAQHEPYEQEPIAYSKTAATDPVAKLATRIKTGRAKLAYDNQHGYLPAVLESLEIPISSQTLVFSKTSKQIRRISPSRPRAIYFNDEVYVGWCQRGEQLEIASTDPQLGAVFYTIDQEPAGETPRIVRDRGQCLSCHATSRTQRVPGFVVRSVFPGASGHPLFDRGSHLTDHTSPLAKRWGGWYVTGSHGQMRHMGNRIYPKESDEQRDRDTQSTSNLHSLDELLRTKAYLSSHSDIVALMVLDHQTQVHNALTAANYAGRQAIHQSLSMNKILERPADFISDLANRRIDSAAERVVDYLLLKNEATLVHEVGGTSNFAIEFAKQGPRDSQGRSLRELDLKTKLLRYPCSYLIYSPQFDSLPDELRGRVIDRMTAILQGAERPTGFAHLTSAARRDLLAILQETKPEFLSRGNHTASR